VPSWADPAWHLFVVRDLQRDALQKKLGISGVDTLIHYPIAPHRQDAYADLGFGVGAFPIAEGIHTEILSLPMFPHMTLAQSNRVISACLDAKSSV
jgi:dTDP-4-amino-4,6-dideoxygalactose transaminase